MRVKAELLEEIENQENQLTEIKKKIKDTKKHIRFEELKEVDQFELLSSDRKRLMDTIKMLAYRAETAMASLIKDDNVDLAAARRILQDLFVTTVDIVPEQENKKLLIKIHGASRPAANRKIKQLIDVLNETDIEYPGTELKLKYELCAYKLNKKIDQNYEMVPI